MRDTVLRFASRLLGGALGVMLGALPSGADAQIPIPDLHAQQAPAVETALPRPTALESHFTRIRIGGEGGRRSADGIDVRVAFARRPLRDVRGNDRPGVAQRA